MLAQFQFSRRPKRAAARRLMNRNHLCPHVIQFIEEVQVRASEKSKCNNFQIETVLERRRVLYHIIAILL